ncbi:MAG: DUF3570 domain-containing protein [Gammaproteobacteria bacterium]
MAATRSNTLKALTTAALALPGVSAPAHAKELLSKPTVSLQYGHYQENAKRIAVDIYQGSAVLPISKTISLTAGWVVDSFAGATPVLTLPYNLADTTSGASGINQVDSSMTATGTEQPVQVMTGASMSETRHGVELGIGHSMDNLTLHAAGARSEEPDYMSYSYQIGAERDLNNKLTTVSFEFSQNFDTIEPTTRLIREEKNDLSFKIGVSQIVDKGTVLRAGVNYLHSDGYLSNPYKKVFVQGLTDNIDLQSGGFNQVYYEKRPNNREQWAISLGYIQYLSSSDSALHLDYRYFIDNWKIQSHTLKIAYHQPIAKGWVLQPNIRYYSQTDASFYDDYFIEPRSDGHYSSDFRLAGFGSLTGGFNLSREWLNNTYLTESVKLELGFDYTTHAAGLKFDGQTASDVTDFSYILVRSSIEIRF